MAPSARAKASPRFAIRILIAAALAGCAAPDDEPLGQVAQPVRGGVATDGYPAVVALLDGTGQPFCTGALIGASEVLTAAHCFFAPCPQLAAVLVGASLEDGTKEAIAKVWRDPAYDRATRVHDIAVVTLARDVAVAPLTVRSHALGASDEGRALRIVGFGRDGLRTDDLRKRAGIARVARLSEGFVELAPGPESPCSGDSGGPVLLEGEGEPAIVGVVSHGDWLCATFAEAVLVDRERAPFLHGKGCSAAPGAPHESSIAAALIAAGALLAVRRRRLSAP